MRQMEESPYYIRHGMVTGHDFRAEELRQLIEKGYIFIHYGDSEEERKEWRGYYKAINHFNDLSSNGGYVIADYRTLVDEYGLNDMNDFSIGYIKKGTQIETISIDCSKCEKKRNYFKALRFDGEFTRLSRHSYGLFNIPFPRGTIDRLHIISKDNLVRMMRKEPLTDRIESLNPPQVEVLCAEYLREEDKKIEGLPTLDYPIAPVGKFLPDIDIVGRSKDGYMILAQVSLSVTKEKIEKLKNASKGIKDQVILLYFTSKEGEEDGIRLVDVKKIYEESKNNRRLRAMIEEFRKPHE